MSAVSATVSLIPDNDRFLPRYLTVQLLEILAMTIQSPQQPGAEKHSDQAVNFCNGFKNPDLFNPLTFSIFWRDNPDAAITQNMELVNSLDKYSRSPLSQAIANEDFILVKKLLDNGAHVYLEDKLILEITLTSMLQRNTSTLQQILTGTAEYDILWVQDYLEYLLSHISGNPINRPTNKYHEVINPPLRHFGQVLDTLVYFNGIPSYYGFISPSIDLLTTHLQTYTNSLVDPKRKEAFTAISQAYRFTKNTCKFFGNLPSNEQAGINIHAQIKNNLHLNNQEIVVLFGGWAGNALAIAFVNKYLVFTNLGIGGNPQQGTKIFAINQPDKITAEIITNFIAGLAYDADPNALLLGLGEFVDPKPLFAINQQLTPIDNCIFVNPRALIQGILLVLNGLQKHDAITEENLATVNVISAEQYQDYLKSLYQNSTKDLANFMRNNELIQNKRLECCSLALEYINQHYNDADAIERCIELKNALEFVGLKDFYLKNIKPEAQAEVQKHIIHEQEVTALKVIQQELELVAKTMENSAPPSDE